MGEDMAGGHRVHCSEQSVSLEDRRVQYRRCDIGTPAYVEKALENHRAPMLFLPSFLEYRVTSENNTISRAKVYHDSDRHRDTQHSKCLADYHKPGLFPRDRVDGEWET